MEIKTADGTQSVASAGVGGAGLGLGIAGTALALLNGGLGGIFGGGFSNHPQFSTKDDVANVKELMAKDQQIAILQSENFTNTKLADVYERLKADINSLERTQNAWNASQSVANAQMSAAIATNTNSISVLQDCCNNITKTVVPITSVCPQPMPQYNSWTAPTTGTTTTG